MVNWTKEQEEAIYTDGRDILVAAAAGSGKTAVLVERIIQKLLAKDKQVDIDSLLVVTFTNAAAQEMRNRVGQALEKALAENPASMHLKKQLSLLQRASISTLHSFCLDAVKRYAYLLDIDPSFRIADDMEGYLIKQEVIDDLFEEWYGSEGEEQRNFFAVVDRFSNDRNDLEVEELILKLYTFATQNPWPEAWLDQLAATYDIPENWQEDELQWLEIIKREVRNQLEAMKQEMELALSMTKEADGPYQYADNIEADLALLHTAEQSFHDWQELQAAIEQGSFGRLSGKRQDCDELKKDRVKKLRDSYKKRWADMKKTWFNRNLESHMEDMRELSPIIRQLTELVKAFGRSYAARKREKALVDFSDLEHFCLQLLVDESSTVEQIVPSQVAIQFQKQFTEVLVDEYQDTNLVQETILTLISDRSGEGNMFMVGDVKQSIYRFRHAEPSLFIEKYKRFAKEDVPGKRIDLASNFRSREHVLTGTNYIFRQILDEELGEINYDSDAELIYGNRMYDDLPYAHPAPELVIVDRETSEEDAVEGAPDEESFQDLEKAQLEARVYAEKIKQWIGHEEGRSPLQVADKGGQRDIQYRDIVILLRSMTWAPTIADELKKQGIPVYAELSTGYFDAIEVKVMISLLKVIDNPRQDIPLAAVLKSPIVNLNEDELAAVRLAERNGNYYDALLAYHRQHTGRTAENIGQFLKLLESFRLASRQGALSELIWNIYRETGYYDFVGGMPGGRQRQANLRALYDRSKSYEETSFRGLFRFLRFIERMEERGDDLGAARALSEQEDVVRMMTIHKSKGLEFPAVILGAMDKQFNQQDLTQKYLLHKDLGFASKYIDPEKRISYLTLFYHALKQEKLRELLAEEMRVLYVALTRAKEKLVMVGTVASFDKKLQKWKKMIDHSGWVLPAHFRAESRTYLDWVGPALMRHEEVENLREEQLTDSVLDAVRADPSRWDVQIMHASMLTNLEQMDEIEDKEFHEKISNWEPMGEIDGSIKDFVEERLSFRYPYEQASHSRAKQTVTEIKRQRELKDEYSDSRLLPAVRLPIAKQPQFMQKERKITSAEKGTALHTVMQHIPLMRTMTGQEIKEFVEELAEREILTRAEADIVDIQSIERFFHTDIARLLIGSSGIQREVPFSITLPASSVYANWDNPSEEKVLIQGIMDCLIPTADGWILLDYKTDYIGGEVTEKTMQQLTERYRVQLSLYREALEKIWKQPVKKAYVYYFSKQLLLEVPPAEEIHRG